VPEPTFDNAIEFARELIRIPSLPGDEGTLAKRLAGEMTALGFEGVASDDLGSVYGVIRGGGDAPAVMLSCHLDMVAVGDESEWEVPPLEGAVKDGYLHGRGAMDIKGPLALQTYVAASMAGNAPGDIIVAHTVLEERGGWGMQHLVESGAVEPAAVIIGESTQGDITIGHRGRAEFEVAIRGVASHASAPERAKNALDIVPWILSAVQVMNAAEGSDPVLGKATAVATGLDVRPFSRNVIPDEAVVVVDWRILPGDTRETLTARLKAAVDAQIASAGGLPDGFGVEVRGATERQSTYTGRTRDRNMVTPGFLMEADHPVITAAAAAVGKQDGAGPATVRPWTFATDGGWTCGVNGIPTLGFAPGEERYAHTNTERLEIEPARWAYGRYPELIRAVQKAL
jgi:succinyl-diaminopimelate desuccinylase